MRKYYTRPCNFYHGRAANSLIKLKKAFPLNGKKNIAFDRIEIFLREKNKVRNSLIHIKDIRKLNKNIKKIIQQDLKKIISKRKNFLKNVNFNETSIMGVLNLTPDSFSDGGRFNTKNKAFKQISNMINSGAKIIDIGGESTRPGSMTIDPKLEWKRVEYILRNFKKKYKKVCLSIDTRKSDVMIKSIKCGADIINDVSGFSHDPYALPKLKNFNVSKILHHMQGTPNTMQKNPRYQNVLLDIYDFFEREILNVSKDKKIILDPGIGFGKTLKQNLKLISNIALFHSLGLPVLLGSSRKSFIGKIEKNELYEDRLGGSIATVIHGLAEGVQIFRVHDVYATKQSIKVYSKIK